MEVDTLVLEPAAAGMARGSISSGNLHYRSMKDARGKFIARRTNGLVITRSCGIARARMTARLQLQEPAGGPLEHLVNLPDLGALSVIARVDGPRKRRRDCVSMRMPAS